MVRRPGLQYGDGGGGGNDTSFYQPTGITPDLDIWAVMQEINASSPAKTSIHSWLECMEHVNNVLDMIRTWVRGYELAFGTNMGYESFRRMWKYGRLAIPLQVRLLVEQVLYEKGRPWSALCTGFQPVGTR